MASRSRSISPVGTSRFEKPYTLPALPSPTRPAHISTMFDSIQTRPPQPRRTTSTSSWSTTDSSPVHGYSTAPTSAQHSPIERRTVAKELEPWPERQFVYHHHPEDDEPEDEWYADLQSDHFYGDADYGHECPDQATLAAVNQIPVFSADGTEIPFGTLYRPETALNPRQLFIFVRHFYCGACQAYVKAITEGIPLSDYFSTPTPTSIVVIGCGSPNLIPFYKGVTGTSFPVFAEPSRRLYKKLGMVLSGKIGREQPEYMKDISNHDWLAGQVRTVREGLRARKLMRKQSRMSNGFDLAASSPRVSSNLSAASMRRMHDSLDEQGTAAINRQLRTTEPHDEESRLAAIALRKRDLIKGGNMFQIGGEFLFEDGEVIWCHRMRHYRDHVEVADIRKLLELDE